MSGYMSIREVGSLSCCNFVSFCHFDYCIVVGYILICMGSYGIYRGSPEQGRNRANDVCARDNMRHALDRRPGTGDWEYLDLYSIFHVEVEMYRSIDRDQKVLSLYNLIFSLVLYSSIPVHQIS